MLPPPPARRSHNMPSALHMPLRTSPDAPHFCGNANSLFHYLAEVEDLCQSRQRSTDTELIKYAVYYTDEASWDTFAAIQDTLNDPATWPEFQAAICDLYPIRKDAHAPAALPALLPPSSVPSAPLLGPLLPAAAVLLTSDALQALLLPTPIAASLPPVPPPPVPCTLPDTAESLPVSRPQPLLPASVPCLPLPPVPPDPPPVAWSPLPAGASLPPVPAVPMPPSPAADMRPLSVPVFRAQSLPNAADRLPARVCSLLLLPMPPDPQPFALRKMPSPAAPIPTPPVPPDPLPATSVPCAPLLPTPPVPPDPMPLFAAVKPPIVWPRLPKTTSATPAPVLLMPLPLAPSPPPVPPCDPSLPEADPTPALTARIAVLAASPSAVLKATIGIRESRHRCMCRSWRKVFQVF